MTTDSLQTQSSSLRPLLTTTNSHTRSSSFFSFLKSNDNAPSTMPSRRVEPSSQLSPQLDEHGRLMQDKRQPPLPSSSRNGSLDRSTSLQTSVPPQQLHPEIRSVVSLTHVHAHKVYMSGPLIRRIERLPDGHQPIKDEDWRDVWAQLGGTTLSIWDMKEIDEASKQGKEVPPTYINVTDAFVQVLGAVTIPASGGVPAQKYNNVVTLNTAGSNLLLFSCPNAASLISWATALRVSSWEKSRLEEIYTAHLIRITLNDGRDAPSTLVRGRREGWVRIRVAGQTDWKHLWMTITAGQSPEGSAGPPRPGSPHEPQRKRRISSLFGREENQSQPLSNRPVVAFYLSPKPKDRKKPFLTFQDVTQAFAVYPERPELINKSTLMKIEGKIGHEDAAMNMRGREGWVLVMPELEAGVPQANETIRWLIAFHDSFSLYGRPRVYSWDPRDPASMMFAYPAGPSRDLLFMEREAAEVMDPREDRTSAVRSRLNDILSSRMQGHPPPKGTPTDGSSPLPQLPPLGFGSSDPGAMHRALTPIIEASSSERDPTRLVISEAPAANPPQQSDGPAPPSKEIRSEDQVPTSTSPAPPVSPPSAYTPTDAASSTPISPTPRNPSVAKPNPEIGISVAEDVSSKRPSNDDGQAQDGRAASTTSLHSSAASPPSLSPANSSNPPASVSPGLAPPRTPSPKFSSFAEFGSSTERLSRQSLTPPPSALRAATLAPSKLVQEPIQERTPPSRDSALDIYDEAGALFYIHQLEQGTLNVDPRPPPDSNGRDLSSESEGVAPRSPHHAQPTVAPLRPRGTSASPPPSQQPVGTPRSQLSIDISHRKPPNQQLPRTPTLDYGPERRPFGARAAPASNRQDSVTSAAHSPLSSSLRSSMVDTNTQRGNMTQLEDPDADALAALTFLERHDDVPSVAPVPSAPTAVTSSPPQQQQPPAIIEPEARSPSPESENASVYKSSFAPSKNAMQRKAKSEAQQAAHEAAAHRPGRGTGKVKTKSKAAGGWGDSSEEEEDEEEDDEDEDVDSDGQPVAPRDDRSVSNYAASANNHRSQYSSPRGPSPLATQPHALPQPRVQGMSLLVDYPRTSGAVPHGQIPTHAPAPVAPRHMWSQVLDPGHAPGAVPDNPNARDTFIQLESPAQAMTKAFTPHGLLSAGLQDKEDRSAKRQEELAREAGASLVNVPSKPPPPQTGLLGAITAHERDRKREGGVGATLTEREREKRLAEDRQRKLDELQRQQLEQMQQGGSIYGQQQYPGFNPMMNPMMMGMNPMMSGFMGYPGMMAGYANPQHMFAAQQAAQAYQQAMLSLSQAGSQIGGEGGTPAPLNPMMTGGGMGGASPAPLNPMMTGGGMGMGGFDPRFSMMGMPMMNPMGMGMGMGNPGMMGNPMGMNMPMNTGSGFDPRMSQFDPGLQPPNPNFAQRGRAASSGQDSSPGASEGARRSASASPRPPQ
ncbi:hypothetical protein BJY52DRAFT_1203440 [Lactarius psammicola]|nr:hypothetical protein BJY52DRAFT_1203440 [Lactarius psammicola]